MVNSSVVIEFVVDKDIIGVSFVKSFDGGVGEF